MDKIVLKDDTEIENATITIAPWGGKKILVSIPGDDLVGAAVLFGNPDKTETMEYYYSIYKNTYYGYSILDSIGLDPVSNRVNVWMGGGANSYSENGYSIPEDYIPGTIGKKIEESEKENNENGPENDTNG